MWPLTIIPLALKKKKDSILCGLFTLEPVCVSSQGGVYAVDHGTHTLPFKACVQFSVMRSNSGRSCREDGGEVGEWGWGVDCAELR